MPHGAKDPNGALAIETGSARVHAPLDRVLRVEAIREDGTKWVDGMLAGAFLDGLAVALLLVLPRRVQ